jgi:multidrug efflux pump subunit AcrA (membrane-fusion protein)
MIKKILFISSIFLVACKDKVEKIKPTQSSITESIYASGTIKSKNQYQAFATVNGIIDKLFVAEGDTVVIGTPILSISNEAQKLSLENAGLTADFNDASSNQGKLNDALQNISLLKSKLKNDSSLFERQNNLWQQQIGSRVELEQRQLALDNSRTAYQSAIIKYNDIKRQLNYSASQSKKNFQISSKQEKDFTIKSEIDGVVYDLSKKKGEIVNPQTSIATIGDGSSFILEMQVDEYDIFKIKMGQLVLVTLDSYKGKVFEATVTKINPLMNERSKTFMVEATFVKQPNVLYPNITFEANIVLRSKDKALLIPRSYMIDDNMVMKANGDKVQVKTGLKDFQQIEILSGISLSDEIQKPK